MIKVGFGWYLNGVKYKTPCKKKNLSINLNLKLEPTCITLHWEIFESFPCTEKLTDSIGNDPSISLNSSLSSSEDNFDKWKSLISSGISVNFPKSLRISGPHFSSQLIVSSIGVSGFSLQTAVGSTLDGNRWSKENLKAKKKKLTRIPASVEQGQACLSLHTLEELFQLHYFGALCSSPGWVKIRECLKD